MKSADGANQQLVPWRPRELWRQSEETAFLPAALEIVETPASPIGRMVAGTIILFFVLAVGWAFFGQVDIIATAQGRMVPAGDVKVIQPLEAGIVRAIHVENGNRVRAGDVLIELDPTVAGADRERLARDLVQARLDAAQFTALKVQMDSGRGQPRFEMPEDAAPRDIEAGTAAMRARFSEQMAKVASFEQQISQKQAEYLEVTAALDRLDATIPVLQEKEKLRGQLLEAQLGNRFAYLDAKQQLLEAVHEREVQSHRLIEIRAAERALGQQRDQAKSTYAVEVLAKLAEAEQKVSGLTQELLKAERKANDTELRAPIDGTVQQLSVHTVGGVVTPAQPLMVIVPRDRELLVEALVSNADVGFVHEGQEVEVKIETFTFTRYGLLHGRVVDISADAVTRGDYNRDPGSPDTGDRNGDRAQSGSPAYVARVKLDQTSLMVDGTEQDLGPGMAVTAEIKTGKRTIMEYLLSPLVARTSESLRER